MSDVRPPAPGATTTIELAGFPVRLWWKLLETAQLKGIGVNYLVLSILAQAVDHNVNGESYDLLVKEIADQLEAK
ncbi:MAG: hypothetical protein V1797_21465 [Pseudomonadota bacterium]